MIPRSANPLRVLVVDDERPISDSLGQIFCLHGHEARCAYSGEGALDVLASFDPQVLVADVVMGGMTGIELARHVAEQFPDCSILLFSGQAGVSEFIADMEMSSSSYRMYAKPIHPRVLLDYLDAEGCRRARKPVMEVSRVPKSDTHAKNGAAPAS